MQQYQKEIIDFTKHLVSTSSQNGIDSEEKVTKLVFQKLTDFGSAYLCPPCHPTWHPI